MVALFGSQLPLVLAATTWADTHTAFSWVVILGNGLVGAWALAAHWYEPARQASLWWCVTVAQVSIFLQGFLGVMVMNTTNVEAPDNHLFYAVLCMFGVAILYGYRTQMHEHRYLLYGGGSLFIMGLAIRAFLLDAPAGAAVPLLGLA